MMEDVQGRPDTRGIAIDLVGICDLTYPIIVPHPLHERTTTIAKFVMAVSLPAEVKGTHMSRFVEILHNHGQELSVDGLPEFVARLRTRLGAERARVEARFPLFLERAAPASGSKALMDYECTFLADASSLGTEVTLGVRVPITTLCPCSKAISDYGAHNQRSYVSLQVRWPIGGQQLTANELISLCEASGSAPVFPLIKRTDERFLTMKAFENPAFAEDVVRNVAQTLQKDARVAWFSVNVVNLESIHNHNAYAQIEWARR